MALLNGSAASLVEILHLHIRQALIFDDEDSSVEVLFSLTDIQRQAAHVDACFSYNAASSSKKHGETLSCHATGKIRIHLGSASAGVLPSRAVRPPHLIPVKAGAFYQSLAKLEYQYSGPFYALSDLERKLGNATGWIHTTDSSQFHLRIHPAVLDAAFQALLLAAGAPDDGTLWSLHVPTKIQRISVDVEGFHGDLPNARRLAFDTVSQPYMTGDAISVVSGDVSEFAEEAKHAMIQVEGLQCAPFSPPSANHDKELFSCAVWGPVVPKTPEIPLDEQSQQTEASDYRSCCLLERSSLFFLRKLQGEVPLDHPCRREGPFVNLFAFAAHTLREGERLRKSGSPDWSFWQSHWGHDDLDAIQKVCSDNSHLVDFRLLEAVGRRLSDIVMHNTPAVEVGMNDHLLTDFYREGLGMPAYLGYMAKTVKQIIHTTPRINCLEIGAGTGAATKAIMREMDLGQSFSSYTFTDVSTGFFEAAQGEFGSQAGNMSFKTLDISRDPTTQRFEPHSFDLVIASMVLHATSSIQQTLYNVRKLLKPGGHLVVLKVREDAPARIGTIFGAFSGWWLGVQDGRKLSPCLSMVEWDALLRKSGFSGCDSTTTDARAFMRPCSLFISQAVDERIAFLRDPLSLPAPALPAAGLLVPELLILGGESLRTARIAADLQRSLSRYCGDISRVRTLSDLDPTKLTPTVTVLSLVDLDEPSFKGLTKARWATLKNIFQERGSILWISQGRRAREPHNNMLLGLVRCAVNELPGLDVQFLDFDGSSVINSRAIGEAVLRFKATRAWDGDDSAQLRLQMPLEREIVIDASGQALVPRLVVNHAMNSRYNSS